MSLFINFIKRLIYFLTNKKNDKMRAPKILLDFMLLSNSSLAAFVLHVLVSMTDNPKLYVNSGTCFGSRHTN
jgi:hypothetical protein